MEKCPNNSKYTFKKSIRVNSYIKNIIEKNFRDVCKNTGLKLSYGKIARAFWASLAEKPALRKKCMDLVCKSIMKDHRKKQGGQNGHKKP